MKQLLIFLKGFATVLVGLAGIITAIGAITTKEPLFMTTAVIFIFSWVYVFIKHMKNNFKNNDKKDELQL